MEICGKAASEEFWVNRPNFCGDYAFSQNFHNMKLGETTGGGVAPKKWLILTWGRGGTLKWWDHHSGFYPSTFAYRCFSPRFSLFTVCLVGSMGWSHRRHWRSLGLQIAGNCIFLGLFKSFMGSFEEKLTLREKCPNTEFFLVLISLFSVPILENMDQKKLRICTFHVVWLER